MSPSPDEESQSRAIYLAPYSHDLVPPTGLLSRLLDEAMPAGTTASRRKQEWHCQGEEGGRRGGSHRLPQAPPAGALPSSTSGQSLRADERFSHPDSVKAEKG